MATQTQAQTGADKVLDEIAALRAENARLAAQVAARSRITVKLVEARAAGTNGPTDQGAKGGTLGVYGLGKFPVCLYREQWEALLADDVQAQIRALLPKMPRKADKPKAEPKGGF